MEGDVKWRMGGWKKWEVVVLFFFFSSRRRHTRLQGDWSSDVCSSDLTYFINYFLFAFSVYPVGCTRIKFSAHNQVYPFLDLL